MKHWQMKRGRLVGMRIGFAAAAAVVAEDFVSEHRVKRRRIFVAERSESDRLPVQPVLVIGERHWMAVMVEEAAAVVVRRWLSDELARLAGAEEFGALVIAAMEVVETVWVSKSSSAVGMMQKRRGRATRSDVG